MPLRFQKATIVSFAVTWSPARRLLLDTAFGGSDCPVNRRGEQEVPAPSPLPAAPGSRARPPAPAHRPREPWARPARRASRTPTLTARRRTSTANSASADCPKRWGWRSRGSSSACTPSHAQARSACGRSATPSCARRPRGTQDPGSVRSQRAVTANKMVSPPASKPSWSSCPTPATLAHAPGKRAGRGECVEWVKGRRQPRAR